MVHLHTYSQSLSVANCIQAGGLICFPGPPDWDLSQSLQAEGRPLPGAKGLFFLGAALCMGPPDLLTSQAEALLWSCRARLDRAGDGRLQRLMGIGVPHSTGTDLRSSHPRLKGSPP